MWPHLQLGSVASYGVLRGLVGDLHAQLVHQGAVKLAHPVQEAGQTGQVGLKLAGSLLLLLQLRQKCVSKSIPAGLDLGKLLSNFPPGGPLGFHFIDNALPGGSQCTHYRLFLVHFLLQFLCGRGQEEEVRGVAW